MRESTLCAWALAVAALFATPAGAGGEPAAKPPGAAADCARDVSLRVQHRYEGVKDIAARFVQRTHSVALGAGAAEEVARGEVVFAKPGRMRWSYTDPEPSLVVSDGKLLWIYDPDAHEVQELDASGGFLNATALQFLLGEGRILDAFEVEAEACGEPAVRLHLRPRAEATYERLELLVDARSGDVRESVIHDLFGNRTTIAFEGMRYDLAPRAELFRFTPGPDDRVLRLEP
jgi:outer membrane lipoprotein-sorting protein